MITSRERLDRCFRQQEIDRPGLYIRGVDEVRPGHKSYEPLRELVVSKCDLKAYYYLSQFKDMSGFSYKKERYNDDFERQITVLNTPSGILYKTYMIELNGNPGHIEKRLIETPEDAEIYLSLPEDILILDTEKFFEMDRKMGDRGIITVDLGLNPAGSVAELLGSERFALWSIEYRDLLHRLMEYEKNKIIKNMKLIMKENIGPYFGMSGEEYITPPLHGPDDFYDFNVRYDKPIVDLIHDYGGFIHIHSHGPIKGVLQYFIEIGADMLHPIEAPPMGNVTIQEAKDILRGKVCIEGNIQIGDMYGSSAGEIRENVLDVISKAFDDSKGLIICPTASPYIPVMSQKAFENYSCLINTVLNYKK